MKPENLLDALNDIDSDLIVDAHAAQAQHRRPKFTVLLAAVIAIMALTLTAFASETISGWFRQYFEKQNDVPLTSEQIQYLEENEQLIENTQDTNGYQLELKSVLADSSTIYVIIGITAPVGTTEDDFSGLNCISMDFYDSNGKPGGASGMWVCDDMDGLDNTTNLVIDVNLGTWNSGSIWTLRMNSLTRYIYNEEYAQELLDTKYAGQENVMFTDEEAALVNQWVTLAEGPWEFTIDLSKADNSELEMISVPVSAKTCYGYKPDGTEALEDAQITSFVLRPLSATIQAESIGALDFTYNSSQRIYVVLKNGSRIELLPNWGCIGEQHLDAASPIVLAEVDHILLADGTKIMAP